MRQTVSRWLAAVLFVLFGTSAHAASYFISVDTHLLAGTDASIAFDFIDGGPPHNSYVVSGFSTDGMLGTGSASGNVMGHLPGELSFSDASFFNEYLQGIVLGNSFSYAMSTSDLPPNAGFLPDAFSLFLLGSNNLSLVSTGDPTGANALLLHNLGDGSAPQAYLSDLVVVTVAASMVPESGSLALLAAGLAALAGLMSWRRRALGQATGAVWSLAFAVCASLLPSAHAADDLTGQVTITSSGFLLNRTTGTFDAMVTVRNDATVPLAGPLQLTVYNVVPANVVVFNTYGKTEAGQDFVAVPLAGTGILGAGQSASVVVKFINSDRAPTSMRYGLRGIALTPAVSTQLTVRAYQVTGDGTQQGNPVGAGYKVLVNNVVRGMTDATGRLTITVPIAATTVSVVRTPNAAGSVPLPALVAGLTASVAVLVGDGGEVYADGILRFDQVKQLLLARTETRLSLRFLNEEQPVRLSSIAYARVTNVTGDSFSVKSLLTVLADGSINANPVAFFQAFNGFSGKATLDVDAIDVENRPYHGTVVFYLVDYRVRIQLVAPPSNPALPLAGLAVTANILNTDILVTGVSDSAGLVVIPDLPRGNISPASTLVVGGTTYTGAGAAVLNRDSLVRLTMRGPVDILDGVPAISIESLPNSLKIAAYGTAAQVPAGRAVHTTGERAARAADALRQPATVPSLDQHKVTNAADPTSISISVAAAAENQVIEKSKQLVIVKGVKKVNLTFSVSSREYPYYVTQQSIFNDVWSLSVLTSTGVLLYDITRQVNSQLSGFPAWLTSGTTGLIKVEIDVTALALSENTTVILKATSVNIGDSDFPTVVYATLDSAEQLKIGDITPDIVAGKNNGTYYSVPRPGSTNALQRTFNVVVTKPSGSTLTGVTVDLLNNAGDVLMQVLQDTAPGQDGVTIVAQADTSATLKVRVTVKTPASNVAGTPPPTRDLGYRFSIKGIDSDSTEISDQKDVSGRRSLWRIPDVIARYGSRDVGGDEWSARGTYEWMATNATLLREVNDVSGEHGRQIGHETHAKGTDIDTYHFYLFPGVTTGAGQGAVNHSKLMADLITAFGTVGVPTPPDAAVDAKNRVAAWLGATRTGLANLAANAAVSQVIHCRGLAGGGLPAGWCETLLTDGKVSRVSGTPPTTTVLDFGSTYVNAKMDNNNVHDDHVHVTLKPASVNE